MNLKFCKTSVLLFLITLSLQGFSQVPEWSIRGGANLSTTTVSPLSPINAKIKAGFHLGFMATLPITNDYSVESGLSYSLKGSIVEFPQTRDVFHLKYLDIPILARVTIIPDLHFLGGPQISYLLANRTVSKINGQIISEGNSIYGLRKLDLGIHVGATYNLQNQIWVGVGYDYGLLSLYKEKNSNTFNRVLKFTIAYHFKN